MEQANQKGDRDLHRKSDKFTWKQRIHEIIFESDTAAGKLFDVVLLLLIFTSVILVVIESIPTMHLRFLNEFAILEWIITIIFSLEYFFRIYSVKKPKGYIFSFYGIIDLLAIVPSYLSLFLVGTHYLMVIRAFRLLRIFRILKLSQFLKGQEVIVVALKTSRHKIFVFLLTLMVIVTIIGSAMYVIEGPYNSNFSSIPQGIYWAVTTLTTVGFGDITPITNMGKFLSTIVMILGYSIIAVPTGIISSELMKSTVSLNSQSCSNCGYSRHDDDALFCKICGNSLNVTHPEK